jgi:hypothetical protein
MSDIILQDDEMQICLTLHRIAKANGHDDIIGDIITLKERLSYWVDGEYKSEEEFSDEYVNNQIYCLEKLLEHNEIIQRVKAAHQQLSEALTLS